MCSICRNTGNYHLSHKAIILSYYILVGGVVILLDYWIRCYRLSQGQSSTCYETCCFHRIGVVFRVLSHFSHRNPFKQNSLLSKTPQPLRVSTQRSGISLFMSTSVETVSPSRLTNGIHILKTRSKRSNIAYILCAIKCYY